MKIKWSLLIDDSDSPRFSFFDFLYIFIFIKWMTRYLPFRDEKREIHQGGGDTQGPLAGV